MNLKERAKQLNVDIPALFLYLKSNDTSILPKILAGITVAYALSPIDLIPDFIPVLGYLDDLIILPAFIALTIRCIPSEVFEQYREEAKAKFAGGKAKKWYFAIPIIVIWLCILVLILKNMI